MSYGHFYESIFVHISTFLRVMDTFMKLYLSISQYFCELWTRTKLSENG